MPINDKYQRVLKQRSVAIQLLLFFLALAASYAESAFFAVEQARTIISMLAIFSFVTCDMALAFAVYSGGRHIKLLLWTEAILIAFLFLMAGRMELMHLFACYWVARLHTVYSFSTSLLLSAIVIVFSQVIGLARGQEWETIRIMVMVPSYGLVLFLSYMTHSERRLSRETHTLNQKLKVAHQQLAEAAKQNERLRIAREIHDVLGHQLTAQILNLEVATNKTQGEALSQVEQSLALAKMMLGDLRNAVRDLRESPVADFPFALANLLAEITTLETSLELPDDLAINDPHAAATLLRCVQEAATNTLRHSGGKKFQVILSIANGQLLMEISDDGTCPSSIVPGHGLIGMQERIEPLGGRIEWQTLHGSLELKISLPFRGITIS